MPMNERDLLPQVTPERTAQEKYVARLRQAERLQIPDVIPAKKIQGFSDSGVVAGYTLEKAEYRRTDGYEPGPGEDIALYNALLGLFLVGDGLGGHGNGDLGSRLGAVSIEQTYAREMELNNTHVKTDHMDKLVQALQRRENKEEAEWFAASLGEIDPELIKKAACLISAFDASDEKIVQEGRKSETTMCAALIHQTTDGRRFALIANIGDGGAFHKRNNEDFVRVGTEDSYIQRFLSLGILSPEKLLEMQKQPRRKFEIPSSTVVGTMDSLSYQDLAAWMTDALGTTTYRGPSLTILELLPGDTLLLCTDGTTDKYKQREHPSSTDEPNYHAMTTAFDAGTSIENSLDMLREDASSRRTFKFTDDQALIALRVLHA